TFKVRNALHQHPLTVTLYNVDRISDLKDSVCNTMPWWKDAVNSSKEIDVEAVLYSVSPRQKYSDDLKIGDIDNRGLYHTRMDCVFVFKVKTAPAAIGTVEVFKVCMFDEGLMEIYVEAKANSSTIHDLKGEIEKVMVMIDLSGCEKRVTQNGNVLSDDTMLNTLESHTVYATLV
ncbi:hypothetical protein A2U01_0037152, partial [Trifolium medium]|nr:hypothetical protein [Trifolium medium]